MQSEELPSKTRRKQAMQDLQELGERLVALTPEQLARLALPEGLFDAVREAQRMNAHGARRRQIQFIGRLMREVDPEPIRAAVATIEGSSAQHKSWHHAIERWRDRLMAEPEAFAELGRQRPGADIGHLRQLARNAQREQHAGRPPRNFRALFQELKALFPEPSPEGASGDADSSTEANP